MYLVGDHLICQTLITVLVYQYILVQNPVQLLLHQLNARTVLQNVYVTPCTVGKTVLLDLLSLYNCSRSQKGLCIDIQSVL